MEVSGSTESASQPVQQRKFAPYVWGAVIGSALAWTICTLTSGASSQSFSVAFAGASVEIRAEGMEVKHEDLLNRIYGEDFARAGLLGWLERKDIFLVSDPNLVAGLVEFCGDIPTKPLQARLESGRACAAKPVVAGLRDLSDRRLPPFHYIGEIVRIGVPEEADRPPDGRANACRNGTFWRREVELTNPVNRKKITVEASGHYPCADPSTADIQLSEADALELFETPTQKYEQAIAVVVN